MSEPEVHGPIDTVIIEFPGDAQGTATAEALLRLVEQGTISLYDLVVVTTGDDGRSTEIDPKALADGPLSALGRFAGARSGLVDSEDLPDLAGVLEPGTAAVVIVYENTWAVPFVGAARGEGGNLVASTRLTAQQIMDAIDTAEAAD